jgi:DeoR family deoxyribose operon repressor
MNKKMQRLNQLIQLLKAHGNMKVNDIAKHLKISEMTVRRDLNELQIDKIVKRVHGKAIFLKDDFFPFYENIENVYNLSSARTEKNEEKIRIAKYAATLIEPRDVIILDNGSTTDKLADFLPADIEMTIICYNLNIVVKLQKLEKVNIILGGGYYHPSDQLFESAENIKFLKTFRANKLFLAASGVHQALGMTCAHNFEVIIKKAILESSLKKILIADSSKFGAVKTVFFASLDEIDMIITDTDLPVEWIEIIKSRKIELIMV